MITEAADATFDPSEIPSQETSDPRLLVRDPVVSVTMITYNHAPWAGQAIESILAQECGFPFELVVAEDCSTDATRAIVLDYQRRYPKIIRVITSAQNVGVKRNVWRAHQACRGRYIAACEGDDYWHHRRKLQKQVEVLENHPEYGLVHSDCDVFLVRTGRTIRSQNRAGGRIPCEGQDLFTSILTGRYKIRTASVCARKELLDRVQANDPVLFRSDRFPMGDTPTWLELSRLTRFRYLDESLATYRVLSESASQSDDVQKVIRFEKACYELREYFMDKYGCDAKTRREVVKIWQCRLADLAFKAADVELARQAWAELEREGIDVGFGGHVKRWATAPGLVNTLARAVQYHTRPLRARNRYFSRY